MSSCLSAAGITSVRNYTNVICCELFKKSFPRYFSVCAYSATWRKSKEEALRKYDEDPLFHGPVSTMSSCQDGTHVEVLRLFHPGIA